MMQYRALVRAEVPRVRCAEHGVQQVRVPWADAQSRFTALCEAMAVELAEGGELGGGGAAVPLELGPGVGDPGRVRLFFVDGYLAHS